MRIVLDTGVIVSGLLIADSMPRQAIDRARRATILFSVATLEELDEVLRRPKFDAYLPKELRLEFLAALVRECEEVTVAERMTICRDPRDDKFLELAAAGRATHVVSGDADLLELHPFRTARIVTPAEFLRESDPQ
jgi:putative PIN family toxin of toxin-antitoxin system